MCRIKKGVELVSHKKRCVTTCDVNTTIIMGLILKILPEP